jgi:anthraniloyl-CoA monooxygenase
MRIAIVGGGPAGLYGAILLKKADPRRDVTVFERNPPGATYGWGVVFSDRTLTAFQEADYPTYRRIVDQFVTWDTIETRFGAERIRCAGHVLAGMSRRRLLDILARRCDELGVTLQFRADVRDLDVIGQADLVVAADGVNSVARAAYADVFGPAITLGRSRYVWLGTRAVFDGFTFIFRRSEHGLFQAHVYPYDERTATFIVECDEATWQRAGLHEADEDSTIRYCERLFAEDLGGESLHLNKSRWLAFPMLSTRVWHHRNVVLVGDAAHTAHFSVGSGTKLAMEDAISLASALQRPIELEKALVEYELERRPVVEALQRAARESQDYFESTKRYLEFEPLQFAFHLLTRSGRVSYDELRRRDPRFVDQVDLWYFRRAAPAVEAGSRRVARPPALTPIRLRGLELANRLVVVPAPMYAARDGVPSEGEAEALRLALCAGAGLVVTLPVAVSPDARITTGCAAISERSHVSFWTRIVEWAHRETAAKLALQLGHAGRRGATRPRDAGVDRPLGADGWPLVAPCAIPYAPTSPMPREADRADMERIREAFEDGAKRGSAAGFDMLFLHFAHGYLFGSFLSPLANRRSDAYGGPLANRMRFPLEVFDAVREVWPHDRPLAVALSVTDWQRGGVGLDEGVQIARAFRDHGCDLIAILAGQTTPSARPHYDAHHLALLSDRVRNEASVPTLATGYMTASGEIDNLLAAGRADLCILGRDDPQSERAAAVVDR